MAEHGARTGAGAVGFLDAVVEHVTHQREVNGIGRIGWCSGGGHCRRVGELVLRHFVASLGILPNCARAAEALWNMRSYNLQIPIEREQDE